MESREGNLGMTSYRLSVFYMIRASISRRLDQINNALIRVTLQVVLTRHTPPAILHQILPKLLNLNRQIITRQIRHKETSRRHPRQTRISSDDERLP